jgi:hypothetical protein
MLKFVIALLCLAYVAQAQNCPFPSTNVRNGYQTRYCYYYAGQASTYSDAINQCKRFGFGYPLIMPKTDAGLDDLYKLSRSYNANYFWVGAAASPSTPFSFLFQDGNPVYPNIHMCAGNPKGGNNLCGFYTSATGASRCFQSGVCIASSPVSVICQAT